MAKKKECKYFRNTHEEYYKWKREAKKRGLCEKHDMPPFLEWLISLRKIIPIGYIITKIPIIFDIFSQWMNANEDLLANCLQEYSEKGSLSSENKNNLEAKINGLTEVMISRDISVYDNYSSYEEENVRIENKANVVPLVEILLEQLQSETIKKAEEKNLTKPETEGMGV